MRKVLVVVLVLAAIAVAGYFYFQTQKNKQHSSTDVRTPPTSLSVTFKTTEEAFDTVLNSEDRNLRYTATLYLKSLAQTRNGEFYFTQIKAYGAVLFQESRVEVRQRVYESMGWFGGSGAASLLVNYLTTEEQIPVKLEIIRALGEIGPEAENSLNAVELISKEYARLADEAVKQGGQGHTLAEGRLGRFDIDPAHFIAPKAFQQVTDESISRIQGQAYK